MAYELFALPYRPSADARPGTPRGLPGDSPSADDHGVQPGRDGDGPARPLRVGELVGLVDGHGAPVGQGLRVGPAGGALPAAGAGARDGVGGGGLGQRWQRPRGGRGGR